MKESNLLYITQERQALYSQKGIFATLIKHYCWKEIAFKTISHMNSAVERELIGELKIDRAGIEQLDLTENLRFWWRKKGNRWQNHFQVKLVPNQAVPYALEKWMENWLTLPMIPFVHYKKGLFTFSIQFKQPPSADDVCKAMELIESIIHFIKKASF